MRRRAAPPALRALCALCSLRVLCTLPVLRVLCALRVLGRRGCGAAAPTVGGR